MGRSVTRMAGLVVLLSLLGAAGAPAAPASVVPLFDWRMPPGFGVQRDAQGRLVEAAPGSVRSGPWKVVLQVAPTQCREDATYRWSVRGRRLRVQRAPGCTFETTFAREGNYPLRLDATIDGARVTQTRTVRVQDWLIVSVGDSVASGEAVPDVSGFLKATWQSVRCHRSARAAPARAAQRIEDDDPHTSVTFVHLACSGATIHQGLVGSYDGALKRSFSAPIRPQLQWVARIARRRHIDALLVSIGANDLYFGDIVRACARHASRQCFDDPLERGSRRTIRTAVRVALGQLPHSFNEVQRALGTTVAPSDVHLVGYFDPTHDARGRTCPHSLGHIGPQELELAQSEVLEPLNAALSKAAGDHRWDAILGIDQLFAQHGYCAGDASWVTTLSGSITHLGGSVAGRLLGTFHPNEHGQAVIGSAIAARLEQRFYPGLALTPAQPGGGQGAEGTGGGGDGGGDGGPSTLVAIVVLVAVLLAGAVLGFVVSQRRGRAAG